MNKFKRREISMRVVKEGGGTEEKEELFEKDISRGRYSAYGPFHSIGSHWLCPGGLSAFPRFVGHCLRSLGVGAPMLPLIAFDILGFQRDKVRKMCPALKGSLHCLGAPSIITTHKMNTLVSSLSPRNAPQAPQYQSSRRSHKEKTMTRWQRVIHGDITPNGAVL